MRLTTGFLVGLMAFWLNACSRGEEGVFHSSNLHRIYGDGLSVNIANVENETEGRPVAERYCECLGKTAHFERMELLSYQRETSMSALFNRASGPVSVSKTQIRTRASADRGTVGWVVPQPNIWLMALTPFPQLMGATRK